MIDNMIEVVGELQQNGEVIGDVNIGGTVGTTNYNHLNNKPTINNVELSGDLTLEQLGIEQVPEHVKSITEEDVAKWNSGTGGGTSDYNELTNHPIINNVEIEGNLSLADLGISKYELPTATTEVLGGVKIGNGLSINDGVLTTVINEEYVTTAINNAIGAALAGEY